MGDIIKLQDGELVPADMILLTTEGKGSQGEAFNRTASLDGETNLKPKLAIKSIQQTLFSKESSRTFSIQCQEPIADLYKFSAQVCYGDEI